MLSDKQKAQITVLRGLGYTQQEIAQKLKITHRQVHYQLTEINQQSRERGDQITYLKTIMEGYMLEILDAIDKIMDTYRGKRRYLKRNDKITSTYN